MQHVVGISDAKYSNVSTDAIVTFSLGSCIGIVLYDTSARIGGMLHYQLPSSRDDPARSQERPLMYADTGMMWLISRMESLGANRKRMQVKLAGAAQMLGDRNLFDIGRRNHAAIRKILWQLGMFIDGEHVGGAKPRTMCLNMSDGSVSIKYDGNIISL